MIGEIGENENENENENDSLNKFCYLGPFTLYSLLENIPHVSTLYLQSI